MAQDQALKAKLEQDGYVVIRGVYSRDEVGRIVREYEKIWFRMIADGHIVQKPDRPLDSIFPRIKDRHLSNERIRDFIFHPDAAGRLASWIGEDVHLVSSNYYFKPPGMKGVPYHQDNYGIGVSPGACYAIWVSLDEADAGNGSMRFAPGSHKLPLLSPEKIVDEEADTFGGYVQVLRLPEGYREIQLVTSPGDIVIYHGLAIHDSTDNDSTDRFRRSLISHFAAAGAERLLLNFNNLTDKEGRRIRKRLNTAVK